MRSWPRLGESIARLVCSQIGVQLGPPAPPDTNTVEAIARGTKMAAKFHVEGTPTVMVNSLRFGSPPTDSELFRAIDKALEIDHRR